MKIRKRDRSANLEDRRGQRMPLGKTAMVGGPIGIIIAVVLLLMNGGLGGGGGGGTGFDPSDILSGLPGLQPAVPGSTPFADGPDPDAELVDFVSFVLDDVQALWQDQFSVSGQAYEPATLVLFTDATQSGCGPASSATGPFYCTLDKKVYLDLGFFEELDERFGAPGDFAQAYVIAHEIAHHVQNETGVSSEVQRRSQENPEERNELSIRLELQADCLAGVWGSTVYEAGLLESGDLEEGLAAAASVGDDRIQQSTTGRIDPESWTHGSAEQRVEWFRKGFDSGSAATCDTFSGDY
ncbi:MAG: neutral zinc metallopeptidase [Dehalococcoidia bacterium]